MKTIVIKTQAELDKLPDTFKEWTVIEIQSANRIIVTKQRGNSSVVARGNSSVVARGNSSVVAWENSSVEAKGNSSVEAWGKSLVVAKGNSSVEAWGKSLVVARGNSSVEARENSSVEAWENSLVVARGNSSVEARENSSVEAWGNSSVVAKENSSVEAKGNSSVEAWENSSVEARGNSSVVARGNSSVVARENSLVEAWGNSSVVAWENSLVVARGNSSVEAWGNSCCRASSDFVTVLLFGFACCYQLAKAAIKKKSKTCTVITPKPPKGVDGWLESQGIKSTKEVILFKRVSKDFLTQEKTSNEIHWKIGSTLEHPNWQPESGEYGAGKFHFCSRPYFCDEFRNKKGDRYVAIKVAVVDLHVWPKPDYPHKIGGRKGTVLYECDRFGKQID